jgi:hypothetical protein
VESGDDEIVVAIDPASVLLQPVAAKDAANSQRPVRWRMVRDLSVVGPRAATCDDRPGALVPPRSRRRGAEIAKQS